jgi:hypothetical protein
MKYDFSFLSVTAKGEAAEYARELFAAEIEARSGYKPFDGGVPCVELIADDSITDKDSYFISLNNNTLTIKAAGIRGLIYGYSYFLRKCIFANNKITS